MSEGLDHWTERPRPDRLVLDGRYARLEPLCAERHGEGLYACSTQQDAEDRFRYLFEHPPGSRQELQDWIDKVQTGTDPMFFAVIDKASGKVAGRQALMRIDPRFGVIEIGSILWSSLVARKPAATEAQYLFQKYVFQQLGYRRYEWKCHDLNEPSKRAALRFGFKFEGLFRQHMVLKGANRDTAWFSIIDTEWPALSRAYEAWLDPANFDPAGCQRRRLEEFRRDFAGA